MNCFPCCAPQRSKKSNSKREHGPTTPQEMNVAAKTPDMKKQRGDEQNQGDAGNIKAQNYTFRELATATKNFRQECLLGETGFGKVYKGIIPATGKAVAVKQLDRHGTESSKEFMDEVLALSLLHHENLSNLIGYCADGDQRLLVYEYIHARTLEDRLLENNKGEFPPLNWFDRMKVAAGASKGLEYLHNSANPPIIFRDLKTTNILLDGDLNVILVDFGMSKLSGGDKFNNAPPRVVGTFGYCAPEYVRTGQFSLKSDVYSFGIILLELITGRRAIDTTKPNEEQNLVSWAQPLFRDPKRYPDMADPLLKKHFPEKDLNQAVAIAAMCLQEEPEARPLMSDVVTALSFLSMVPTEVTPPSLPPTASVSKESCVSESEYESESESESEAEDNETARNHVAASAKNQHGSSKSSRKSSRSSIDSGDGSVSSSSKSSRKWHGVVGNLSHKGSKKSASNKDPSQKGSKKSSTNKDQSQKSSRKSSIRDLIHKGSGKSSSRVSSHRSDGGSISSSSSYNSSVGSDSRRSGRSDINSSRRTEEESMRFDRASSMGSDEESVYSH